jgi:tRNA (uracil-5-)-methyltransferase TRM9
MIYVWAYEQGEGSKRKMGKRAARNDDDGAGAADHITQQTEAMTLTNTDVKKEDIVQDVLVPWVLQPPRPASTRQPGRPGARRKKRPATTTNGEQGAEYDEADQEGKLEPAPQPTETAVEEPKVYHRYYHLFLRGELRELVVTAAREDGYEVVPDPQEQSDGTREPTTASGPGEEDGKWMRVLKEGWEADNWWIECEVGRGAL